MKLLVISSILAASFICGTAAATTSNFQPTYYTISECVDNKIMERDAFGNQSETVDCSPSSSICTMKPYYLAVEQITDATKSVWGAYCKKVSQ